MNFKTISQGFQGIVLWKSVESRFVEFMIRQISGSSSSQFVEFPVRLISGLLNLHFYQISGSSNLHFYRISGSNLS